MGGQTKMQVVDQWKSCLTAVVSFCFHSVKQWHHSATNISCVPQSRVSFKTHDEAE